jgi:hypothetical protein
VRLAARLIRFSHDGADVAKQWQDRGVSDGGQQSRHLGLRDADRRGGVGRGRELEVVKLGA